MSPSPPNKQEVTVQPDDQLSATGLLACGLLYGDRFPKHLEPSYPTMLSGTGGKLAAYLSQKELEKTILAAGGIHFNPEWMTGYKVRCRHVRNQQYTAYITTHPENDSISLSRYISDHIGDHTIGIRIEDTRTAEGQQPFFRISEVEDSRLIRDHQGDIIGITKTTSVGDEDIRFGAHTALHIFPDPRPMEQLWLTTKRDETGLEQEVYRSIKLGGGMLVTFSAITPVFHDPHIRSRLEFRIETVGNNINARDVHHPHSKPWYKSQTLTAKVTHDGQITIEDPLNSSKELDTSDAFAQQTINSLPLTQELAPLYQLVAGRFIKENAQGIQRIMGVLLSLNPSLGNKTFECHWGVLPDGSITHQAFDCNDARITQEQWLLEHHTKSGQDTSTSPQPDGIPTHPSLFSGRQLTTDRSRYPLGSLVEKEPRQHRRQLALGRAESLEKIIEKKKFMFRTMKPSERLVLSLAFLAGLTDQPAESINATPFSDQYRDYSELNKTLYEEFAVPIAVLEDVQASTITCLPKEARELGELIFISLPKETVTKKVILPEGWNHRVSNNHTDLYISPEGNLVLADLDGARVVLPADHPFFKDTPENEKANKREYEIWSQTQLHHWQTTHQGVVQAMRNAYRLGD